MANQRHVIADPSLWFLFASNIITIYFAIRENWNINTVMWIYWFQSIIIGFFNFLRILRLEGFSTKDFKINGQSVQPTRKTKMSVAFFFALHYGLFHFVYLIFISTGLYGEKLKFVEIKFIVITAAIFFLNHLFSYFYNGPRDTKKQNIGTLMFFPYARIIPMHLTIIFGFFPGTALILFLILKTFADGLMHVIEHNVLRKGTVNGNN